MPEGSGLAMEVLGATPGGFAYGRGVEGILLSWDPYQWALECVVVRSAAPLAIVLVASIACISSGGKVLH